MRRLIRSLIGFDGSGPEPAFDTSLRPCQLTVNPPSQHAQADDSSGQVTDAITLCHTERLPPCRDAS
jgi:hypothetical protein